MQKDMRITLLSDFYGAFLTPRQLLCVDLYFNQDFSLGEIAEQEGITRQAVRDSLVRAESQLRQLEEKLGLCAKYLNQRKLLDELSQTATERQQEIIQKINALWEE